MSLPRTFFLATALLFSSASAHAAELSDKGEAKIRYFMSLTDCTEQRKPELLDHSDVSNARRAVAGCEDYAERAEHWLSEVPESNRKHASYLAALAVQNKRKAVIAEWRRKVDARSNAVAQSSQITEGFRKDVNAVKAVLFMTQEVEKDIGAYAASDRNTSAWPHAAEQFGALEAFSKECESGKYRSIVPVVSMGEDIYKRDVACGLAQKGLSVLPRGYEAFLKAYAARMVTLLKRDLASIAAGKSIYQHTFKLLVDIKPYVEKERAEMGAPLAKFHLAAQPALFDEWIGVARGLDAALAGAKKKSALANASFRDGALGSLATHRAKTVGVSAKPVSYGFFKPQAEIEKNDIGIPTAKFRRGKVLLQFPNEKFCRAYEITLRADYAGGGKFAPYVLIDQDPIDDNDGLTVGSCAAK